jgi:hypothetical protein
VNIHRESKSPNLASRNVLPPNRDLVGKYSGIYRRIGTDSLIRLADDLHLEIKERTGPIGPNSSPLFLIDKSADRYLSNLYKDQFDDRLHRYRISLEDVEDDTYLVEAIWSLVDRQKHGGKTSHV